MHTERGSRQATTLRAVVVGLMVGLAVTSACGTGSDAGGAEWTTTSATVDGVMHVANTPPESGSQPTLVAREQFRIGTLEGGGPTSFGFIRNIAVLPDGRFAVADGQAEEVRLFDAGGGHLVTFGGEGEGPGELKGMQGVHLHGGMLRVAEQANARLSVFHPDSGFVRTYPLRLFSYSGAGPWRAVVDSAGRTHVMSSGQYGEGRFWSMVRVYDTEMVQLDSVPYFDYTDLTEREEVPGAWRVALGSNAWTWAQVPFYSRPYELITRTGELWSTTEGSAELEVSKWDPRGDTSLVFTSLRAGEPVTTAERDSAMTALRERLAQRSRADLPTLDPSKVPATKPPVYGLLLDDRDRLWVRLTPPSADTTDYDVFDPNGHYALTVRLPFRVDTWVPPVVHGDTVWVVLRDEMDVQFVTRAMLLPAAESGGAG